jgi:hypothetical protein
MAEIMNFKRNSKIYLSGNEIGFDQLSATVNL